MKELSLEAEEVISIMRELISEELVHHYYNVGYSLTDMGIRVANQLAKSDPNS